MLQSRPSKWMALFILHNQMSKISPCAPSRTHTHTQWPSDFWIHSYTCIATFSHKSQNIAYKVRRAVWPTLDATLWGNNYSWQLCGRIQMDLAKACGNLLPMCSTQPASFLIYTLGQPGPKMTHFSPNVSALTACQQFKKEKKKTLNAKFNNILERQK